MALWNGLGQAATVAQLAGIDAAGLITMIVQAVQTVQRNKVECQLLVSHVTMINDLLQLLQQSETMRRPEIWRPLDGLEDVLRIAYMLVTSCQKSNIMYRFIMAGNEARQFREIRDRIDSYLRIYPLISHIDTRYFITELYSRNHPSGADPQASEETLGSFTGHSNPDSRTEGSASADNGVELVEVQAGTEALAVEVQQNDGYLTAFNFSQLAASTNNFSPVNRIGYCSFGMVFKGILPDGLVVSIKMGEVKSDTSLSMFEQEVLIIPKLKHANVVKLLGYCIEGDKRILVYEYVHNGSLYHRIHGTGVSLYWATRFRIIEGIIQGVAYLNHHSRPYVIHRDLKTRNILLDYDVTPRITDFGLAVVVSSYEEDIFVDGVAGTIGYTDPEYIYTRVLSFKSDVYAFGVILLEIISARHPLDSLDTNGPLAVYAWELWSSGRAMELIDPSLLHEEPEISNILRCIHIALLCVQEGREDRPTMADVLIMLKCEPMTLPEPRPPRDFPLWRHQGCNTYSSAKRFITEEEESLSYLSYGSSDGEFVDGR